MTMWNDFNNADDQLDFDLIPRGTKVKVRMTIKPGGYDDPEQGWVGGYASQSSTSPAVYLNCEFVILEGKYAKRKVFSNIGLYSSKGPEWANMGRAFVKGILNSANNLHPQDNSPQAQNLRRISGFADLDGIEFIARIDVEKDSDGESKNVIKAAITPDNKAYAEVMNAVVNSQSQSLQTQQQSQYQPQQQQQGVQSGASPAARPSWAQ